MKPVSSVMRNFALETGFSFLTHDSFTHNTNITYQ